MLETTETDDLQKLAQADVAFHDVIYQATNNERLIQLLNNLREQMYRYRIEYLKDVKSRRSLVEEHDALYERMKNRDLAGAQKMIREHIVQVFFRDLCYLRTLPRHHDHKAVQLQHTDRLADRGTRNAELICQPDLHQPFTRL